MIARRGFLGGLLASPFIIRTPGLLMPIPRRVELPEWTGPVDLPTVYYHHTLYQQDTHPACGIDKTHPACGIYKTNRGIANALVISGLISF